MNLKSNLAYKLDPEILDTAALNAVELDTFLRLGSHQADVSVRAKPARRAYTPVSFQDNHSLSFRAFRIY